MVKKIVEFAYERVFAQHPHFELPYLRFRAAFFRVERSVHLFAFDSWLELDLKNPNNPILPIRSSMRQKEWFWQIELQLVGTPLLPRMNESDLLRACRGGGARQVVVDLEEVAELVARLLVIVEALADESLGFFDCREEVTSGSLANSQRRRGRERNGKGEIKMSDNDRSGGIGK
ncbi:unnamed protein product [Linum trigynum]|uniref:Uncharacterized protein n=1 Tax=Linum trigynum TaxID=586398 RepID=A0AAV2CUX7_9ROSI